MLAANWPYVINTLIFIGYFIFWQSRAAWPEQFLLWAWVP